MRSQMHSYDQRDILLAADLDEIVSRKTEDSVELRAGYELMEGRHPYGPFVLQPCVDQL